MRLQLHRLRMLHRLALVPVLAAMALGDSPTIREDGGCFDVRDYGAMGDGVADDTGAFNAAAAAAGLTAGCMRISPAKLGAGYVITGTVTIPVGVKVIGELAGLPAVPHCYGPPGDLGTTGGARIFARPKASTYNRTRGDPLFVINQGCTVRGLMIFYDQMPFPTDAEFANESSKYYIKKGPLAEMSSTFFEDMLPSVGPTFYVQSGVRVVIEDVVGSRYRDFIWFEPGCGQSHVRRVHGWGYGRFLTVVAAEDVMSVDQIRVIINSGPDCLGPAPPASVCEKQVPPPLRCLGNFSVIPALVAASSQNVGIWLGRADGYVASDLFMFGINTALRLGFAPGRNELRNPVTGNIITAPGASSIGSQTTANGPWGAVSRIMVDQALIGIHFVWPNPLTNRFSDVQLHPSFWTGETMDLSNGTGSLIAVGREAAILVEKTHSLENNKMYAPTTMFSNMVVASFNDSTNFGAAGAELSQSNGKAFLVEGASFLEVQQLSLSNEVPAQLWGCSSSAWGALRIRSYIVGNMLEEDEKVFFNN